MGHKGQERSPAWQGWAPTSQDGPIPRLSLRHPLPGLGPAAAGRQRGERRCSPSPQELTFPQTINVSSSHKRKPLVPEMKLSVSMGPDTRSVCACVCGHWKSFFIHREWGCPGRAVRDE